MSVRDVTNRVIVSRNAEGTNRILNGGLRPTDVVICEDVEGWNEADNITHDVRQATFPTADSAGVHVGSTYSPRGELALTLVYVSTDSGLAQVASMNAHPITDPLWLQVVESDGTRIAGYKVFYSGFSIDDFFNEGCRVTYRYTTTQAKPTQY